MNKAAKRIYLSSPHMGGGETKYIDEAFEQNWVAPLGPNVDNFEKDIASFVGAKHVAALSSGTAAIHLALIILGVEKGDEVIASTFTFSATINPIVYQGAIPILVDSEPQTWNMNPDLLIDAIKDRMSKGKKPKAIIPVHLYGMPANMNRIIEIANQYEIPVIEDAAEALGSRYDQKSVGSFGKMAVFSFNGNKIITTSGGGALVSDDEQMINKARFLSTQARDPAPHYQHSQLGYNYRISNILAGIGRGQMEIINERVKRRREINCLYENQLSRYNGIIFQKEPENNYFSNHWLTTILVNPSKARVNREFIRLEMEKENIETRPLWKPMHLQPVFSSCPSFLDGTSEKLFETGLCLPSGSNLTEIEFQRIMEILHRCFKD